MSVLTFLIKISKESFNSKTKLSFFLIVLTFFRDNNLDLSEFEVFLNALFVSPKNTPYPISKQHVREILNCFDPEKVSKRKSFFTVELYIYVYVLKDTRISRVEFERVWTRLIKPTVSPKTALVIVDVQNDFVCGTMAVEKCPAKQKGEEVVPVINNLIDTVPFDAIVYTLDWHSDDHCSFIENVHLRKLSKFSPVCDFFFVYS